MSFLQTVERARAFLEKNGRVSLRALQREFGLDEDALEELIEELTEVQRFAVRDGNALARAGDPPSAPAGAPVGAPEQNREPRSYTPKHLAEKILQSKSALEGERKHVTVMFADVKGSMELAEHLDPEAWHAILDRFFAILGEGVHRFEGTVNQYTGDGIMALFGAPIAHEDHAHRACYAALHLRQRLREYADELRIDPGVSFSFRVGLNSGEVIVGKIGDDLRMDYTAQGLTVGLAQRMEQIAPPDGIALSQHTQKSVDGFFDLRPLGPARVKGAREPVGVFVLEDVGSHRTRLDTSRARGLSRFVGREDEMAALEAALERSLEGSGRVAAAVGEAGVGKSRLCAEFVERCRARGLAVYEAHCPAHGKTIPYLPLLELLRNLFGITDRDGPREARQKIAGELALLDDAFADDRALVLDFLGVGDPNAPSLELEPAVRQRRLFTFLRRLIQLRTEAEPIVLLIDDLHWIDPGSDLFLAQIVEAVSATRTLLLVNFRPEYEAAWTRKSWVLQLPMAPLGADALAELVRDWIGSSPSVAALPALIAERSGGNPFFAEEIVLSLLDTGRLVGTRGVYELATEIDAIEVPATVQSLLAARIDRLGDREKQLLHAAAVIGKEFPRPLLESVVEIGRDDLEAALTTLLGAELVHERALYPVAEYAFKHPLTHEVALGAQLATARRARHAAVAKAIEAAEADRLDEHAGLLAHHWSEAGEALQAATWHVRAARWVQVNDLAASQRHWTQARELLVALPDSPERTRLLLEVYPELINTLDRLGTDPAESESIYREAVELARSAGDRAGEARIEAVYAWLNTGLGDWAKVRAHAETAIRLADAVRDPPSQLFARMTLTRAMVWTGSVRDVMRVTDELPSIEEGDAAAEVDFFGWSPYIDAISLRASNLAFGGRPREASALRERVLELCRRAANRDLTQPIADSVWTYWFLGDAELALRTTGEALERADRFGSEWSRIYALTARGIAHVIARQWNDGLECSERALAVIEASGAGREWQQLALAHLAVCQAELGRDEAVATARAAVELSLAAEVLLPSVVVMLAAARALRLVGGPECLPELERRIADALDRAERIGNDGYRPFLLIERAGLARARGDEEGLARDLAEARDLFARMGVTAWDDYARSIEA
jgi:class 3 adenylate cyclase/tetratricopeptide (TPR) repeat protein